MADVIEFERVEKLYAGEKHPALHDVTFSVAEGEFVCLIGPSGCGKSTVLKLISDLEYPTAGVLKKPTHVAMAFQSAALFPWLTVYQNVAFGLEEGGKSAAEIARAVQRVGIARALAVDPAVLLLDEPFSALDPKTTAELHDDIIAVWRQTKKTIVMVSHLIEEAVSLADRVILMRDGTIDSVFPIDLPYPRRESENFHRDVMHIRRAFFR